MNKEKLLALLAKKTERKAALVAQAEVSEDVAELRSINGEMDTLNAEIKDLEGIIASIPDETPAGPAGNLRSLGAYGLGGAPAQKPEERGADKYDTPEYRNAFKDYVLTGRKSDVLEFRIDATSGLSDVAAVIPTTIMNKIVEKKSDFGRIFSRITQTAFQGGLEIPTATLKPSLSWPGEGVVADKQKKTLGTSITFSYYKAQVRVAVNLEASTVSLGVFEQTIADNINEAIVKGLETVIIAGTGVGQPLGIIKDTGVPAGQIIEVAEASLGEYKPWTELLAKMPRSYRAGAVLILNDADWNKYIVGMVDANGQPVARTTFGIDGLQQDRFLGKEVIAIENDLPAFGDAAVGDIFGIICKLEDYILNSNMQITYRKYYDEGTDEWISKATLICDGKLADKNGVVLLKKK